MSADPGAASGGPRTDARLGPTLAWIAGLSVSWALACWGLSAHLLTQAAHVEERISTGWRWHLGSPIALVGEAPTGINARFRGDALLGRSNADGGFLSLAFDGERLDARRFSRFELDLAVDRPTELLLFHRETLDGPVIAAPPIPVSRGRQTLRLALDRLPWHAQAYRAGRPVGAAARSSWGGASGLVASLRLHPATDSDVLFALGELRILPADKRETQTPPATTVPLLGRRPASVLAAREAARASGPEPLLRPSPALPLPSPWLPLTLALALLGVAVAVRSQRRLALLGAGLAAAAAALLIPAATPALASGAPGATLLQRIPLITFATGVVLALAAAGLLRHLGLPAGLWRLRGAGWWIAAGLPALLLPALALAVAMEPAVGPSRAPAEVSMELLQRFGAYLPWALAQQWVLQVLLTRALGGHGSPWALVGGSVLFGWLHFPNLTLMLLTSLLALVAGAHFRRRGALLPLALGHAAAGTLALTLLPRHWLWDGTVGMRFFGGG